MKNYEAEFIVNGHINRHGLRVSADCFTSAFNSVHEILHNVYDGFDLEFEVVSIVLVKCS